MAGDKKKKQTECKGMSTETMKSEENTTNSESVDSIWKTPSKLKEEVQTIIDIMGPSLSPKFSYNTSSEADNEESIFTNSKFSSVKFKTSCNCPEKNDIIDYSCNCQENMSTAADINTTTISTIMDDTDTNMKVHFPDEENFQSTQFICPPPLLPANVCLNSECFCPQVASMLNSRVMCSAYPANNYVVGESAANRNMEMGAQNGSKLGNTNKHLIMNWLKSMVPTSGRPTGKSCGCEYYKMNVKKKRGDDSSPPRRVVFDLVQGVPKSDQDNTVNNDPPQKPCCSSKDKKNINNELQIKADLHNSTCKTGRNECDFDCPTKFKRPIEKTVYCDTHGKTRVDVYYFDHGSFNHYRTTDAPPLITTEKVADKTEKYTTRFWAEAFGPLNIVISFVTSFLLQLLRFIFYSICRPLTIGIIQLTSDYFFKPLLATLFNGVVQPTLIFFYNIASSLRDLCDPISEGIGYFLRELSVIIRAFRVVEVIKGSSKCNADCKSEKKYQKNKVTC